MVSTISVLYVDDESVLLDIGKLYLERTTDFSVITTSSARAALDLMKSNDIQAIVSDYQMPGMDGIELLKAVRAMNKSIPFILFTGRGREEIAIQAFENGADFYLQKGGAPKPQFAELSHKIKAAVNHRRADLQVIALQRLYTVLSATNHAIVRIHDKKELLNEICRIVVDDGGFTMAWAGFFDGEKHLIEPIAQAGYVEGFLDQMLISTDDIPLGQGPTGTAFRKGMFTVCNDIESDPKMALWRKGALERGYRSLAAFPFALDTRNAGVISFYASESGFFTDQIIELLHEQSGDISFALGILDHEEQRIAAINNLKKSEIQYRRLFETAQDAILILEGDTGKIIDANAFILDMLGYPLEYCIGKNLWELGFIRDKSIAQHAFTELKTNGYIRYEDLPLETKDGRSITVDFISHVYNVGDKKIFQCNIRDITSRKVFQDALKTSETRYRRLFETAQDAILILDGDAGEIIDANAFILDMLGYPLEYCIGKHLWELGFIKDKSIAQHAFAELKTNGRIRYEDLPLETKDGRSIDVDFIGHVYYVGDKKIFQCNIRDITSRKVFQDALKISEIRYRRLFETAQDAILILDGDTGEIIDANGFILDMLGYPLEYCIGKHLWELGFIKDKFIAQHAFAELKTKGYIRYEDLPLETKDGRSIDVDFISHVYLAGDKKIFQCNIRDITARRHVRDALVESEAQYRTLFEYTSDAVFIMNSTVILDCNHNTEVISGCSRDQILGSSPVALSPKCQPDGRLSTEKAKEKIDSAFSGEPQFFEWVQTRYDHTTFNVDVILNRIVLKGDYCLQAIVREVPDRR
ncbi:PAS domain S-box protein [Methanosphaerula palustris]|uniref:Putative PAS/PAC sensor protein n=1 Tax=Methanosphaerula palustris (strain ATCC BAA-1556 / DSM 19958 / E1-9c) TaxID=521011 RepID=B8GEN9_METPE|nr:PAS domain S-box protein [Methanosphaerula palustris]ACL17740.1 putative PAS/PAC sensor protein [Methanosphaerula palustris E1-9c]